MDGTCKTIHCDYDGYIEYVGSMLLEKYKTSEKVHELIMLGNISSLKDSPKETISLHFDKDSDWETNRPLYFPSFESMCSYHSTEIVYFMMKNKTWICQIHGKSLMQGYTIKRAISLLNMDEDS
jgi:hypothetical protein